MPVATDKNFTAGGVAAGVEVGMVGEADALGIKQDVAATATAGSGIECAATGDEIAGRTGGRR